MKIAYVTLGCKVNQNETGAVEALLRSGGHTTVGIAEADAIIINTCAVTGESARKSRGAVRSAKRTNPTAKLIVCGCFAQSDEASARALGADFVGGAGMRCSIADYINGLTAAPGAVPPADSYSEFEVLPAPDGTTRTRSYLKIQDGCDNFCSYCIIPYLRGAPRSLAPEIAVDEARALADKGYNEIVLTGIEISSYTSGGSAITELAAAVADAIAPARVRLGSLEPTVVTPAFAAALAAKDNICPHYHLSLQSGSAGVLRRMRRKYTPDEYAAAVELLRGAFPNAAFSTDLIVGFPGESDAEFGETLDFLRRIGFMRIHIFPYSRREGTAAAELDGHLPNAEKHRRAAAAKVVAGETRANYLAEQVGRTLHVLFESEKDGVSEGHSENYLEVRVRAAGLRGKTLAVTITASDGDKLTGELHP